MSARAHAQERAAAEAERARAEQEAREAFEAEHAGHVTHTERAPEWFRAEYGEDFEVCSCGIVLNMPMAATQG